MSLCETENHLDIFNAVKTGSLTFTHFGLEIFIHGNRHKDIIILKKARFSHFRNIATASSERVLLKSND